ncbi:MAG: alpha-galactosidase, partial [Chloroflexi bacterium]|nr:alpha-galactosidase [Chloroflexota bacterium]
RYQWGSWWVYGSAVDERRLRQQIDVIADSLGDLGPWHIVVDAGWEDVGPNGSGDLGSANAARFPSGMRALVDYAHARGIRVLLFYSAVYAHDGSDKGEWLGLPGLISEHPDWFIRLSPSGTAPARYLFDYGNPSAKEYLSRTLARFAGEYDADGVKIDGLGDVEGQLIPFEQRVSYLPQRWRLTPVMDIYRLVAESLWSVKPDAFVESGWVNPAAAHPYAHTFRFGDEWNVFDREYPFPGLAQHFTYAAVQRSLLGQRPNIGAVFGGFGPSLTRQWLGAALALGAHVSIGNDLTLASPESLAALRALLVHYRPFAGTTRTGDEHFGLRPNWAATTTATTTGELSFVGLLNREHDAQIMALRLVDALPNATPGATYLAYDVEAARYVHVRDVLRVEVPAQTFRLFVLRRAPGVFWTTSSFEEEPLAGGWRIAVRGPAAIGGRLQLYLPGGAPRAVRLDGVPLPRMAADSFEAADVREAYTYDAATGVLTLRYVHAGVGYPARAIDVAR